MTSYDFGEIVLVPFPFTDQTASKKRPAVIVSSTSYNLTRPDIVLMAITSQIRRPVKADEIEVVEWQNAGLLKPSMIKPVFSTLDQSLILQRLGKLRANDSDKLKEILLTLLG